MKVMWVGEYVILEGMEEIKVRRLRDNMVLPNTEGELNLVEIFKGGNEWWEEMFKDVHP